VEQGDLSSNPDADKYEIMCNWLREGGSFFPKLKFEYYDKDYRGIHAGESIGDEELIISIPQRFIMTTELARASEIGRRLATTGCIIRSKHSYLACYLLQERDRGQQSFWHPYIDCLPVDYKNMPINFDSDELAYLKGSFSLGKIHQRIQSLHEEYDCIISSVPEFARFSYEDFSWARHVVITRIFGIIVGGIKTEGLVPVADLLNHRRPRDTKWTFDTSMNAFTIVSIRAMVPGEQIFDSYGRKCNSRFFVNYGFSLEENEDNEAVFTLDIPEADPLYHNKLALLGRNTSGVSREFQVPANPRDSKFKEMISFARFAVANEKEMQRFPSSYSFVLEDIDAISIRNEIDALRMIKESAQKTLEAFETTVEEDARLLQDPTLTMNIRNCILMRKGEKEVALFFKMLAEQCQPLLNMSWNEFQLTSQKYSNGGDLIETYISDVVRPLLRLSI